jgi:hypothetical protein
VFLIAAKHRKEQTLYPPELLPDFVACHWPVMPGRYIVIEEKKL